MFITAYDMALFFFNPLQMLRGKSKPTSLGDQEGKEEVSKEKWSLKRKVEKVPKTKVPLLMDEATS